MKTIQQRLQSRISKRRNFIRFVEENVADDKASRHAIRVLDLDFDHVCESLSENIINGKKIIREAAADQKLDKQLAGIVLGLSQRRRHYGLSDY
jgi:hypothetical protein